MSRPVALISILAACLMGCHPTCVIPTPGSCSVDSDCVLAFCSDSECAGCGNGSPIAKAQVGESTCLLELGSSVPPECGSSGPACPCPCSPPATAACIVGTCAKVVPDGGPC